MLIRASLIMQCFAFRTIFKGSLKQNTFLRTVSKKEVETALGKWFTNARDRDGNRALRAQPNLVRRAAQSEVFEAEDSVLALD
ncbi:hypothetical protein PO909_023565 [Leuciscus waleckii]